MDFKRDARPGCALILMAKGSISLRFFMGVASERLVPGSQDLGVEYRDSRLYLRLGLPGV